MICCKSTLPRSPDVAQRTDAAEKLKHGGGDIFALKAIKGWNGQDEFSFSSNL
jgi:hypothetical protein